MNEFNGTKELEDIITGAYTNGTTIEDAEKHAARFLHAQMFMADQMRCDDLDARMRKSGLKAIKSAVRTQAIKDADKKPTEGVLEDMVNLNEEVVAAQEWLDRAEVSRDSLERYYNIFREAHIYFRGLAKGNFGG